MADKKPTEAPKPPVDAAALLKQAAAMQQQAMKNVTPVKEKKAVKTDAPADPAAPGITDTINANTAELRELVENVGTFNRNVAALRKNYTAGKAFTAKYITPALKLAAKPFVWCWNLCHKTNKKTGVRKLSKFRAAFVLAATLPLVGSLDPVSHVGEFSRMIVSDEMEVVKDPAKMAYCAMPDPGALLSGKYDPLCWHNKQTLYLYAAQKTEPQEDIWTVTGCDNQQGCGEKDAFSFRVKPSLAHTAWSYATRGNNFIPDLTAAPISAGVNKCEVTYYGQRGRFMRIFQTHADLLDATCVPIMPNDPGQSIKMPALAH